MGPSNASIGLLVLAIATGCTSAEPPAHEAVPAIAAPAPPPEEPIGADQPRQPVPGPDGDIAPHVLEYDGRDIPDTSAERHTNTRDGFAPIADRMPGERIEVATMREFVTALGSDRTIVMHPNLYIWRDEDVLGYDDVRDIESYDGLSEHYVDGAIRDVENLTIAGLGAGARILQPDSYDHVLAFHDVRGLTLYNLVLGHHTDRGSCAGGVVRVVGGRDVVLDGLDMFGSGTEGVTLQYVDDVEVRSSVVRDCSEQLSTVFDAENVRFVDTVFRDNGPDLLRGFNLARAHVELERVTIRNNRSGSPSEGYGSLFSVESQYPALPGVSDEVKPKAAFRSPAKVSVRFRDGDISDNHFDRLSDRPAAVKLSRSQLKRNGFGAH